MVSHRGTVIMATRNEAESIPVVLAEIDEAASILRRSGIDLDVLLVDNLSVDDTVSTAMSIGASLGLKMAHIAAGPSDIGRAHLDGYRHALQDQTVDFVVTIDADGQHDARQICDVVRTFLVRRSAMTVGSRWVRGGSSPGTTRTRALISRVANGLACRVSGVVKIHDSTTSFRVIRRDCAELLCQRSQAFDSYGFFSASVAIAQAYGFVVDEVPIEFRPRLVGSANPSIGDISTYAKGLLTVRAQVKGIRIEATKDQAAWAARNSSLRAQSSDVDSTFGALQELNYLANSDNFFSWIVDQFEPHLGRRIVEVGAGLGTVAQIIAKRWPNSLVTAIEPAANVFGDLQTNTASLPNVTALQITSRQLLAETDENQRFDSVVYVNVLEHILDDIGELKCAHGLLRPDGTLAIFVPAMPSLYGSLDFKSGHHRRYARDGLKRVLDDAGFDIIDLRYLDVAGVLPYWLMYRVLNRQSLDSASAGIYDRLIVPVAKVLQSLAPNPPFGKNLVAVARPRADA